MLWNISCIVFAIFVVLVQFLLCFCPVFTIKVAIFLSCFLLGFCSVLVTFLHCFCYVFAMFLLCFCYVFAMFTHTACTIVLLQCIDKITLF